MASEIYGTVLDVATINLGTTFTADTIVGATTLPLYDVSIFEDISGQVFIDGTVYSYTAVDYDANTLTLSTGLVSAATAVDTIVELYPPAPHRTALVDFGVEEGEAVRVTIPYYVSGMPDGVRAAGSAQVALIEERTPGELYVKDVMSEGMVQLGPAEDLDNYTSAANFIQKDSTQAASGFNYPVPYAGVLEVLTTKPSDVILQRYTAYRSAAGVGASAWVRTFGEASWSAWSSLNSNLYALKGSNEGLTSNTTVQDDNELFLDLSVGVWDVDLKLSAICSSGIAADIKTMWTFSGTHSTLSATRLCLGPEITAAATTTTLMRAVSHGFATEVPYGVDDVIGNRVHESLAMVVTAAGRLQLRWAQNGASAQTTTVLAGSRLTATRLG